MERQIRGLLFALFVSLSCTAGVAQTPPAAALRQSFDVHNPVPPAPFNIAGRTQLVYELHLTNFSADELELTRVEVADADPRRAPLADLRDAALSSRIGRPATKAGSADKRVVAPGARVVLYLWLSLDSAAPLPSALKHRIEFDVLRAAEPQRVHTLVESDTVVVDTLPPVVLDPPLRGGPWAAIYDAAWERGHRRVLFAVHGRARIPARYAIDWIRLDPTGKSTRGEPSKIENWLGYAADVLAVADSSVAALRDGIAESATLAEGSARRHTLDEGSGNYIALKLGQGRYAFYEHLKPGSIRVKVGERVRSGQVIASLGYTGDSTGPHLHFHVSDANAPLAAEGRPYVFRRFDVLGVYPTIEAFAQERVWSAAPAGSAGPRRMELPAGLSVIDFGKNPEPPGR